MANCNTWVVHTSRSLLWCLRFRERNNIIRNFVKCFLTSFTVWPFLLRQFKEIAADTPEPLEKSPRAQISLPVRELRRRQQRSHNLGPNTFSSEITLQWFQWRQQRLATPRAGWAKHDGKWPHGKGCALGSGFRNKKKIQSRSISNTKSSVSGKSLRRAWKPRN